MADSKETQIDDIVSMLDQFMSGNGGHMNINVSENGVVNAEGTTAKSVTTTNSTECADGDSACRIPTLFEGLDDPGSQEDN